MLDVRIGESFKYVSCILFKFVFRKIKGGNDFVENARELGGFFNSADDYMRVFDRIDRALGADVATNLHCHFSKIEWTGSGEKRHLTFEDTVYGPNFEPLMEVIAKNSLTPTIISESAGTQSDDALTMKKYYLEQIK